MTEQDIIKGLREDSGECFRLLYDRWVSVLYHYVLSLVKSDAVAQDVVQNTFVKLWERRKTLDPTHSVKAYLFTISYHDVVSEFRRQARNPTMMDFVAWRNDASSSDHADARLSFDEFSERLGRAKAKLTPRQREIFELRNEFDLKPREIEDRLGLSNQTVRNQLAAAMRIVRKELGDYAMLLLVIIYETNIDFL